MAIGIHCCKDCIPPKRYYGCHATCEEYIKEKAQYEEDKRKIRQSMPPKLSSFDFQKIVLIGYKKNKRRK